MNLPSDLTKTDSGSKLRLLPAVLLLLPLGAAPVVPRAAMVMLLFITPVETVVMLSWIRVRNVNLFRPRTFLQTIARSATWTSVSPGFS